MRFALALSTPTRNLAGIAGSAALVAFSFLAMHIRASTLAHGERLSLTWRTCSCTCAFTGMAACILLERGLRAGMQHRRWSDDDLEQARRYAENPLWTLVATLYAIGAITLFVLSPNTRGAGLIASLPFIIHPRQHALSVLRPPPVSAATRVHDIKVLQSTHWGKPPTSRRASL